MYTHTPTYLLTYLMYYDCIDIVFANSTCFDNKLIQAISTKAENMKIKSKFITFTYPIKSNQFKIINQINLTMSWGLATCIIHEKIV